MEQPIGYEHIGHFRHRCANESATPDHTHPFGHGRIEYVSSLIVAFMICMVGLEQLRTAVEKLPHPDALQLSPIAWTLLVASVLVKLWMFSYNRYLARRVDSTVLAATSADSLSDVTATTAVILASVLSQYVFPTCPFSIDGARGIVVSLLILRSGWGVAAGYPQSIAGYLSGSADRRRNYENGAKRTRHCRYA